MITALSDWFQVLALLFQPIRSETQTNRGSRVHISRALCRLRVITSSFDWFTGLSPSFLILFCFTRHSIATHSNDLVITYLFSLTYCNSNLKIPFVPIRKTKTDDLTCSILTAQFNDSIMVDYFLSLNVASSKNQVERAREAFHK